MEKEKGRNTDFETGSLAEGQIAAVLSGYSDMLRSSPFVKGNHGRGWRRSDKLRFTSSEVSVTDQACTEIQRISTDAGRTVRGLRNVTVTVLMSTNTSGYSVLCTNSIGNLPR